MIRFDYLEIIKKQLPDFEFQSPEHLFRAEKILKAEAKLNESVSTDEIEKFINFFNTKGNTYAVLIQYKALQAILSNNLVYFYIELKTPQSHGLGTVFQINSELAEAFAVDFQENIWHFVSLLIQKNKWELVYDFLKNVPSLFSFMNSEKFFELMDDKLSLLSKQLLPATLSKTTHLNLDYSIHPFFYGCLSHLNARYFNNRIAGIYNQFMPLRTDTARVDTTWVCKVLYAIGQFEILTQENKKLLYETRIAVLKDLYYKDKSYYYLYEPLKNTANVIKRNQWYWLSIVLCGILYFMIIMAIVGYVLEYLNR
ncbi:hypothetical protein [Flavobacterium sp.]|uniref:hypothetical protein n=1 Tax=Flavobacterium sp. TaxID=239 RepID=UPI003D13D3FF